MAWKKLAFTDEVMLLNGSQAMSGTLMMGDYFITGITQLSPSGTTITVDGILDVNSHKITSVTDPTAAQDAATKAWVEANTVTNPMTVALDMNDNNIEDMCAFKAHDALGIAVFDSGDSDRLVLCPTGYGFLTNSPVDMNKQEIEAMCFENLASAPATPGAAQIYYDTADDHLYVNVV